MTGTIELSGELTIGRIVELRDCLHSALSKHEELQINVDSANKVDTAFLQLMCATHRSAIEQSKKMFLTGVKAPRLRESVERLGFVRHIGCSVDCDKDCIWMET